MKCNIENYCGDCADCRSAGIDMEEEE